MAHSLVTTRTVTTAGTPEQISTGTRRVRRIYFKASEGNTGDVYLAGSDVTSTLGISLDQARPGTDWHEVDFSPSSESEDFFWADAAANEARIDVWMVFVDGEK